MTSPIIHRGIQVTPSSASRALLLSLVLAIAAPVIAASSGPVMTPNFRDTPIEVVAEAVSAMTGRTIIMDPGVTGNITVLSSQPLGPDAIWETFLAVLEVHGLALVPSGRAFKIVQEQEFRTQPGAEGARRTAPDDVLTRVIALQHVPAAQVVPPLRPLVSQYGHLAGYPASNVIIVSDRAANVDRLMEILRRIDQAGEQEVEVLRLEHATASEIVRMITALRQGQAAEGGPQVPVVADERTNSVLISGSSEDRVRLRTLVAHLDTPMDRDANTQVVYLNYADAETLAETLRGFVEGQAVGSEATTGGGALRTSILSDADTNALIITAPPQQMRSIQSVISRLDIRRAQVLVEAILVEVSSDVSAEFGITWAIGDEERGYGGFTNFAGSGAGIVQLGQAAGSDDGDFVAPDGVTFGVGTIEAGGQSFGAILRALEGDGTTNILSTPYQVTLDNEEATFSIGQEVPFITGQFTNTGAAAGSVNPFQTIEREEVGTSLTITPQINEGDAVRMDIALEVSSVNVGASGAVDLVTNKRTLDTSVIVDDGQILVLGGLIDDATQESEQRVPVLGSIPGLGALFRYTKSEKVKRNLLVFIRPVIIRDSAQAAYETDARYRYLRDELYRVNQDEPIPMLGDEERPALPDYALEAIPLDMRPETRDAAGGESESEIEGDPDGDGGG